MKLFNSLTKSLTEVPGDSETVTIYSCGPTVYDHAHIGNLISFMVADSLRRVLKASGRDVKHVMNYTDVDDKTIKRSRDEHSSDDPMAALQKLTRHYEDVFLSDMHKIGVDTDAITFIRATESIEAMQALIRDLHAAGVAYITDDGVYFSIAKYKAAGKTYGQLVEITAESTGAARVDNDEYDKDNVHDFALWKKQKESEPAWKFELDGHELTGRPGWHIECSAMAVGALGQPFAIHTGGVDLKFPHHENEIAQSTAASDDDQLAHIFIHNEHLLVDGKKMSKSLNNFYTLEDIEQKDFEPLAFRLLSLQSHYRHQLNFTWASLQAAQNRLRTLKNLSVLRYQAIGSGEYDFEDLQQRILAALTNDLDTPKALAIVSELEHGLEQSGLSSGAKERFVAFIDWLDNVLGLKLAAVSDISLQQKELIDKREAARQAEDFNTADELRNQLNEQGIKLLDTEAGPIWQRT